MTNRGERGPACTYMCVCVCELLISYCPHDHISKELLEALVSSHSRKSAPSDFNVEVFVVSSGLSNILSLSPFTAHTNVLASNT